MAGRGDPGQMASTRRAVAAAVAPSGTPARAGWDARPPVPSRMGSAPRTGLTAVGWSLCRSAVVVARRPPGAVSNRPRLALVPTAVRIYSAVGLQMIVEGQGTPRGPADDFNGRGRMRPLRLATALVAIIAAL